MDRWRLVPNNGNLILTEQTNRITMPVKTEMNEWRFIPHAHALGRTIPQAWGGCGGFHWMLPVYEI